MAKKIQTFNGDIAFVNAEASGTVIADTSQAKQFITKGLTFTLTDSHDSYIVSSDFTTTFKGELILPDYYEGFPVVQIGGNAFQGQTRIEHVKLPKYLTKINSYAFSGCTQLKDVEIPQFVSHIYASAFAGCTSLTNIYANPYTPPTLGSYAFQNIPNVCRVYVAPNRVSNYQSSWTSTYGLVTSNILPLPLYGNAETATIAINDVDDNPINTTYAKKDGRYENMTVGFAINATKTEFTNGEWTSANGGSTITLPSAGTYQITYSALLLANADFGVIKCTSTGKHYKTSCIISDGDCTLLGLEIDALEVHVYQIDLSDGSTSSALNALTSVQYRKIQ